MSLFNEGHNSMKIKRFNKRENKQYKEIYKMKTLSGKTTNSRVKYKINKKSKIKFSKVDSDLQDLDYEKALIYDKINCIKMYWGFLVDSQIILGTFWTDNYFDLYVIKLSFLVFTFQLSFFLNSLFYTNEYISDAYHNDGVLDFVSGLPKLIYSFIFTLIITDLLRMLSNKIKELIIISRNNRQFKNYEKIINNKLAKLRNKLIIYFILVFLFALIFLYYVMVFCVVYIFTKYWLLGSLESFALDFLVSLIICIFLSIFRYISIKAKSKYFYILTRIISIIFWNKIVIF